MANEKTNKLNGLEGKCPACGKWSPLNLWLALPVGHCVICNHELMVAELDMRNTVKVNKCTQHTEQCGVLHYPVNKPKPDRRKARLNWAWKHFGIPLKEMVDEVLGELEDLHCDDALERLGYKPNRQNFRKDELADRDTTDRYDLRSEKIEKLEEIVGIIEDLDDELEEADA